MSFIRCRWIVLQMQLHLWNNGFDAICINYFSIHFNRRVSFHHSITISIRQQWTEQPLIISIMSNTFGKSLVNNRTMNAECRIISKYQWTSMNRAKHIIKVTFRVPMAETIRKTKEIVIKNNTNYGIYNHQMDRAF